MPPPKRGVADAAVPEETDSFSDVNETQDPSRAFARVYNTGWDNPSSVMRSLQSYDGLPWVQEASTPNQKDCPLGFICGQLPPLFEHKKYPCEKLQNKARSHFYYGDIFGGIYCPGNRSYYENCPIGFYCPKPTTKLPCPAGFFCPHKTAKPEIVCRDCGEQSTRMARAKWGFAVIVSLAAFVVVAFVVFRLKAWFKKRKSRLKEMEERFISADRERLLKQREKEQLERIRPRLEEVAERLQETIREQRRASLRRFAEYTLELEADDDESEDDDQRVRFGDNDSREEDDESDYEREFLGVDANGNLWFDADILFDTLDFDQSGDLSYEEINSMLRLNPLELHHFVQTMNELGGIKDGGVDGAGVSRSVFIEHFLEALEVSSNYRCTTDDAARIFDNIANEGGGTDSKSKINASRFFGSGEVNHFMTEVQINTLLKKIRNRRELRGKQQLRNELEITKSEFVSMYPHLLDEVSTAHDLEDARAESRLEQGFDIAFSDLSLSVNVGGKKVNVVDRVTGRLQARTMTALMGGSGAGKTSLLNALCGRASYGEVSGTMRINGHIASVDDHKDTVGFVPQDDIVYPELTVKENLLYSGRFQLKAGTTWRDIEDLADETLANLGLTRVKDSRVGDVGRRGVSGGERKRVNIGIELMRKPSILFLDEPTSGLDASSAMLLVKCLKGLVETRGITVCGVIHQPRKYIFDIFDSLILLSDGGRVVYEGPTNEAEDYFSDLNYVLPSGEGVADWLIDIASGRLRPLKSGQAKTRNALAQSYYQKTPQSLQSKNRNSSKAGHTSIEKSLEKAKLARENLCRCWRDHFASLEDTHEIEQYLPPKPYKLPTSVKRPGFLRQLSLQTRRNLLLMQRNWIIKGIDTLLIVGAVILISGLSGVFEITVESNVTIPFGVLESDDAEVLEPFFPMIFRYATEASKGLQEYALKVGVITAVLVGLSASRAIVDKKLQFYREAASGYDTNAYFLAINITSTIEHGFQILMSVVCAYWLRQSATPIYSYFFSFFLMAWLCISWSFLLSILAGAKNAVVVIGFFMALFGLLFSGGLEPVLYSDIYDPDKRPLAGFCGITSITRYFIEAMAVAEHRSLPAQSGFTYIAEDAIRFPSDATSFHVLSLAQNDSGVVVWNNRGWYWSALPGVIVGVAVRVIACGFLHLKAKRQDAPIRREIREQMAKPFIDQLDLFDSIFFWIFVTVVICIYLLGLSIWLILRQT